MDVDLGDAHQRVILHEVDRGCDLADLRAVVAVVGQDVGLVDHIVHECRALFGASLRGLHHGLQEGHHHGRRRTVVELVAEGERGLFLEHSAAAEVLVHVEAREFHPLLVGELGRAAPRQLLTLAVLQHRGARHTLRLLALILDGGVAAVDHHRLQHDRVTLAGQYRCQGHALVGAEADVGEVEVVVDVHDAVGRIEADVAGLQLGQRAVRALGGCRRGGGAKQQGGCDAFDI